MYQQMEAIPVGVHNTVHIIISNLFKLLPTSIIVLLLDDNKLIATW